MNTRIITTRILSGLALAGALAASAFAQSTTPSMPPGRAVRLSIVEGQVRLSHLGSSGNTRSLTDDAVANTPLFEGTGIQTGDDGRAEIQFEDGSIARIPPDSSLTLTTLKPGATELTLNSGLGYFEIRSAGDATTGPIRVHFDSSDTVSASSAVFRVKLDTPPGEVAVFDGSLHIDGPAGANDLHGGESAKLDTLAISESVEPDSWDSWNSDRDEALNQAAGSGTPATQGLPDSNNPAWGDLNQNGNWYNVPDEGYVWSPYDASDSSWDPYGDGYWADTPGYGYTWVSGYSWGYLPYSCGLWNWYPSFGWGWAPGGCHPWWRGTGGGWGINVGHWPGGWRPPTRPPRPHRPIAGGGGVRIAGPASPIISVHRTGPAYGGMLPLRGRGNPVTIGSSTVVPMRPVTSRPAYNHQQAPYGRFQSGGRGQYSQPQTGNSSNGGRQNYVPNYRTGQPGAQPGGTARPAPSAPRTYSPPASAPRSYSPPPRSYSPPPSAPRSSPPPSMPRSAPSAPHH